MTTPVRLSPLAGKPAPANLLADVSRLITAYYTEQPDPAIGGLKVIAEHGWFAARPSMVAVALG